MSKEFLGKRIFHITIFNYGNYTHNCIREGEIYGEDTYNYFIKGDNNEFKHAVPKEVLRKAEKVEGPEVYKIDYGPAICDDCERDEDPNSPDNKGFTKYEFAFIYG